jgi:hypothetical protein
MGLVLQGVIAFALLKLPPLQAVFLAFNDGVNRTGFAGGSNS